MAARRALSGANVWYGRDMVSDRRWLRQLPAQAMGEIDAALGGVRRRNLEWHQIRREDFPLPSLGSLLEDIAEELEDGCGMVKLRGFDVASYGENDLRRLYYGLGTHLGTPVYQNRRGELMRAIRDEGADVGQRYGQIQDKGTGGTFLSSYARTLTNGRLRFHTDRTDAVGLLCVRQARSGGVSRICSSTAVRNTILERRPDLLSILYNDFWRSRLGEESDQAATVYRLPIFGEQDGRFTSHYSLTYIEAAELVPGVPKLTQLQREAIDMLMAVAEELCFEMTLEPGDLQLLNSHVTYHGRTPFEDDKEAGQDRLLLRLWLSMPNSRPLPAGHEVLWGTIDAGRRRGGIAQVPA